MSTARPDVPIDTEPHLIHTDSDGIFGDAGWDERMAFVRDSEGNLVGLASRHAQPTPESTYSGHRPDASPT